MGERPTRESGPKNSAGDVVCLIIMGMIAVGAVIACITCPVLIIPLGPAVIILGPFAWRELFDKPEKDE